MTCRIIKRFGQCVVLCVVLLFVTTESATAQDTSDDTISELVSDFLDGMLKKADFCETGSKIITKLKKQSAKFGQSLTLFATTLNNILLEQCKTRDEIIETLHVQQHAGIFYSA